MNGETIIEVLRRLIGPITPTGESKEDEKRAENLDVTLEVLWSLLDDIEDVAKYHSKIEGSIQEIGLVALDYLHEIGNEAQNMWDDLIHDHE